MNANLNRGAWKQMENKWVKALEEGKTVKGNYFYTYLSLEINEFNKKKHLGYFDDDYLYATYQY